MTNRPFLLRIPKSLRFRVLSVAQWTFKMCQTKLAKGLILLSYQLRRPIRRLPVLPIYSFSTASLHKPRYYCSWSMLPSHLIMLATIDQVSDQSFDYIIVGKSFRSPSCRDGLFDKSLNTSGGGVRTQHWLQ